MRHGNKTMFQEKEWGRDRWEGEGRNFPSPHGAERLKASGRLGIEREQYFMLLIDPNFKSLPWDRHEEAWKSMCNQFHRKSLFSYFPADFPEDIACLFPKRKEVHIVSRSNKTWKNYLCGLLPEPKLFFFFFKWGLWALLDTLLGNSSTLTSETLPHRP